MRNIKLKIEYDGTDFVGWQSQSNGRSVQKEIEKSLEMILQQKISLIGAGRTDSGVHARGQIANFKSETEIPAAKLKLALNSVLPCDIKILSAEDAPIDFHARYSAKFRKYSYYIATRPTALFRNYSWYVKHKLDKESLKKCAELVIGEHNFEGFSKYDEDIADYKSNVIFSRWIFRKSFLKYEIEANRFLYGMVRGLVGTMIDVARKYLSEEDFIEVLENQNKLNRGQNAPARGLFLESVKY